jgi:lipoprotein-releasing system permease protein
MGYETWIGLRYLVSTRDARRPSIITIISMVAVAVGVASLIVVLAVHGGFEGDLRNKILATKAHVLVTGESYAPIDDPTAALNLLDEQRHVLGAAPFIESELLITSRTNYTGVVLRGIDPERVGRTSDLPSSIREGQFDWLMDPAAAQRAAPRRLGDPEIDAMLRRLDELEEALEDLNGSGNALADGSARGALVERPFDREAAGGAGRSADDATAAIEGSAPLRSGAMPGLAAPGATAEEVQAMQRSAMPGLALPGTSAQELQQQQQRERQGLPPLPGPDVNAGTYPRPAPVRELPGMILGTEMMEVLHVGVGDVVELVSPDGPIGPTGPTPTVRRFRVVAAFYTGLYEFDSHMAYITLEEARRFLMMGESEVTGIEVRVDNPDHVDSIRPALEAALSEAQLTGLELRDWKQLNSSLFSALMLEKLVIGLLVMIIVLVASFAIVCVLIMVVIQKGAEIAILRTIGTSQWGIVSIFVVQGTAIGVLGTAVGATIGLGLVWFAQTNGIPLDPEVYYIDQVPLEIHTGDVVAILAGAVASSMLATLYPSVQAARLTPAAGLRYE